MEEVTNTSTASTEVSTATTAKASPHGLPSRTELYEHLHTVINVLERHEQGENIEASEPIIAKLSKKGLLPGFVDIEGASQMLGVSIETIYSYIKKRNIPHYKPSGKLLFFEIEELKEWVRSHKVKTRQELEAEIESVRAIAMPIRSRLRR